MNESLAWTDITWLLHAYHVSWRYYVQSGAQPDCQDDSALTCKPVKQSAATLGMWNPLPAARPGRPVPASQPWLPRGR